MNNLAGVLADQGKLEAAESLFRDALKMHQRLHKGDHLDIASSLNNVAFVTKARGNGEEAERLCREALKMYQRLLKEDHPELAMCLNNVGVVLLDRGKLAEAETLLTSALQMRRRLLEGDHQELVSNLDNLGLVSRNREKFPEAERFYRAALEMRQRLLPGDHPDLADCLNKLAQVVRAQWKLEEAERLFRAALKMRQRLYKGDNLQVASSLNNLAFALHDQERLDEAETFYREALRMRQRLYKRDHPDLASSTHHLGFVLQQQGKFPEAEEQYRAALGMWQRLLKGDDPRMVLCRKNLARVLEARGRFADAETLFREALQMDRRLHREDHRDLIDTMTSLALLLQHEGKLVEAEPLATEALKMAQRLYTSDHPDLAACLHNLALLQQDQGKLTEAERLARESLKMFQRLYPADHPHLATSLNNLGHMLQAQGKAAEAERLVSDSLKMRQRLSRRDHPSLAKGLHDLAGLLLQQGRLAEAESLFRDSLKMYRRLYKEDHPELALALHNLAGVFTEQGKVEEAARLYDEVQRMWQRVYPADHPHLVACLTNRGNLLWRQDRLANAEDLYRKALRMEGRLIVAFAQAESEGNALTHLATLPGCRDSFLSLPRGPESDAAAIYAEVWQSKGAIARVYEARALAARAAATSPRATALLEQLTDQRRQRSHLILSPAPRDRAASEKRDADLARLTERITTLEGELRPHLAAAAQVQELARATPGDLQKALPADTAFVDLLHYSHFEPDSKVPGRKGWKKTPHYAAFVLTRERVVWRDLGPAGPITQAIDRWREALTTPPFQVADELPAKVRELCWEKVRGDLPKGIRIVYLCPDLALARLPWSALPGDRPATLVLEEFAVAVVLHGPFLLDHLRSARERPTRPSRLLAVGGVAYGEEPVVPKPDPKLLAFRSSLAVKPGQKPVWTDLPFAAAEAKELAERAKRRGLEAALLSGREASAERVLAELARSRIAHLATHGFFADPSFRSQVLQADPRLFEVGVRGERVGAGVLSPLVLSGLVFAGANREGTAGRGLVTGEALVDRDLSGLELAVLSACETGLGDTAGGEGVFGLQRALHVAGCRDVVASLWKVPDAATAALMAEFYRALWEDKLSPVLALQKAQLAVYRADPKRFRELAMRGFGVGEKDLDAGRVIRSAPVRMDGRNPAVLWAAFTLSGPGR
jgi:CHAT domain-containing protein/tetratricopeptide (TPR) repeat protein